DRLRGGGIETRSITEIAGPHSGGKTQLCHALAVNVQLPRDKGGLDGGVSFYDTEGTFRTQRIIQIAKAKGLDPEKAMSRITVATCLNSDQQEDLLRNGAAEIEEKNVRLIIVDSLIAQYRSEYIGRDLLPQRQQYLNRYMHKLSRIAHAFNLAVAVTNQAISNPTFFGALSPAGGNIVGHSSVSRLWIRRPKWNSSVRIARLTESPWLDTGECVFRITERGVEDKDEEAVKLPWTGIPSEPESRADLEVLKEMIVRGYGRGLNSQFGVEFNPEKDGVRGTTIDLFWDAPINHAVFLDGEPVHNKKHQAEIDNLVTEALQRRGIKVQRIAYKPPLTKKETKRIADEIERALKEARKEWQL
ncbi:MAG: DNA repair and recombination protein RadA, partial [Candidatus Bathyarchaeia archaeon]